MAKPYDVAGALKAGYSKTEIADHLAKKVGYNVAAARKAGYSDDEIIAHLTPPARFVPSTERAGQMIGDTLSGIERGMKPVADIVNKFNPITYATNALQDIFAPGRQQREQQLQNRLAAQAQQAQRRNPISYGGGKIAGEVIATLPAGAVLGTGVRAVTAGTRLARGGEAVARGLSSGGFKTGLVPTRAAVKAGEAVAPKLTTQLADLGVRAATGATTGAATSALLDQDAALGAAMGALLPTAGSMVFRTALDKVYFPVLERLKGQVGAQRAAAIFRSALNMTVQEAKNLAASLPKGMTFGEGLVRAGKVRTEAADLSEYTVQALQKDVAEGAGKDIYDPMARAQTAREQSVLNAARGGDTAAKADANLMQRREQASAAYDPAYEAARQRANVGAGVIPQTQAAVDQMRNAAAGATDDVRRFAPATERFAKASETGAVEPSLTNVDFLKTPEQLRMGQLSDQAEKFTVEQANASLGAGATARTLEQNLADLEAQGIRVLESGPIAAQIRAKALAEGITADQSQMLLATADDIAAFGPIIRAGDLDAIYRVGGLKAQTLIQRGNPTGMAKQTSRLLQDIQPDIAAAIENAGGRGYSAAKTAYATEMQDIGRQKFAGELSDIYGTNESLFADVMGGETGAGTDIVMGAFPGGGKRNFDVNAMLGPKGGAAGPSRLPGLQDIAGNIQVRNEMAQQAGTGSNRAGSLMKNPPVEKDIFALGNLVKTPVSLTTAVASPVTGLGMLGMYILDFINSGRVNAATGKALAEGLQSGKSAEELLSLIPRADRAQILRRAVPDVQNRAKSSFGANIFNSPNVMVGTGTGPSGESYPMYGDPSENQNAMRR